MSMNQLQPELLKLLLLDKTNQNSIIKRLDELFRKFGFLIIEKWRHISNNKNSLLHDLVEKEMTEVIRHVVLEHKLDINIRRDSDGLTPLQLALENQNLEMCDLLKELGAKEAHTDDVSKWMSDEDKEKSMNIVWVDLEMTSIEEPEILECAVIVTDKDLGELERGSWVIHFEQSVLDSLAEWHQETFADRENGGNNLFADVLKSKLTKDRVEEELLALIKRHCPEKQCPLAGSSIHIDKGVLQRCMPKVHDYLHYRIIDVTSFQLIMKRWAPWIETKIKRQVAATGQEIVNHRAMDDIIWSISIMKQFRPILTKTHEANHKNRNSSNHHYRRSGSESASAAGGSELPRISSNIESMELYGDEKRLVERILHEKKFDVKSLRLNDKWQRVYDDNPHLREVLMNKEWIEYYNKDFVQDNRLLTTRIQRSSNDKVHISSKKISTTEHWGQRKLLLTEIEFLTNFCTGENYLVVYAGAAPGSHINYLGSLFPQLDFVLIDDKEISVKPTTNIQIRSEKFTNDMAKRYSDSNRKILFICNVRTFRPQGDGQNDGTEDMLNQMDWYKLMKSPASLLYLRLPREPGKSQHLKGYQIIEPWSSKRSTECRLIVKKDAKLIDYDHKEFEENLLHFQYVTRVMYYKYNMDEVENEGLDHCYDCRAEIYILQEYLIKVKKFKNDNSMKTRIAEMSHEISRQIEDKKRPQFIEAARTLGVIPKK